MFRLPAALASRYRNWSRYSFSAAALLCSPSFALNRRVTLRLLAYRASFSTCSRRLLSSAQYLLLNSFHFPGSWPNHFRNEVLGAISLTQSSISTSLFFSPLGQRRSTSTRRPSDLAG